MKKLFKGAAAVSAAAVLLTGCHTDEAVQEEDSSYIGLGELIGNMYVDANTSEEAPSVPEAGTTAWDTTADPFVSEPSEEQEGGHLTILSWEGNSDVANMVENFIQNSSYSEYDIEVINCGDNGESARDLYPSEISSGNADIIVLDLDFADQYFDSGYCMPMSDIGLFRSDFSEAFDYSLDLGTSSDGVFMGASPYICPGGFVYRADLAREYLGVNSPEEMQELLEYSFVDTAQTLFDESYGGTKLLSTYSGLWTAFKGAALPWVSSDNRLNTSYAEHFYDLTAQLQDIGVYGAPQWDRAWYESISCGYALGEFLPTWGLMDMEYSQLGQMCANGECEMAFCKGPSAYYWGGIMFAAASSCDDPTMAREFIEYTCNDTEAMRQYAEQNDGVFVNNHAVVSNMNPYNSLLRGENYYKWLVEAAEEISAEDHSSYDVVIASRYYDSVLGYLNGDLATLDDALSDFKKNVVIAYPDIYVG